MYMYMYTTDTTFNNINTPAAEQQTSQGEDPHHLAKVTVKTCPETHPFEVDRALSHCKGHKAHNQLVRHLQTPSAWGVTDLQ